MPPPLAALPALAALALLPGLLVVRAPWTAVPALSLAFWAVSAWWLPGTGRGRAVSAALLASLVLALLRLLPKHEVPPPPGWAAPPPAAPSPRPGLDPPPLARAPSLSVAATALLLLAPSPLWDHAPGPRLAFQTTTARLLVWRDGVPASGEPLLPLAPVGAHAPALATLAADVSTLSGVDPPTAVLLVLLVAAALLVVGAFAVLAVRLPPPAAAAAALAGLAVAPWPGTLRPLGEGETILALALVLPAAALLAGHASRSSGVAASLLLAGGALAQPLVAAVALAASGALAARGGGSRSRPLLVGLLALGLAAPGLLPLARALSLREASTMAGSLAADGVLAPAFALLLVGLASLVAARAVRPGAPRWRAVGLTLLAGGLVVLKVHAWVASGQLAAPVRDALRRAAERTPPLAVVCADPPARDWVPALAARAVGDPGPWIPGVYAEEWAARPRRPCNVGLDGARR